MIDLTKLDDALRYKERRGAKRGGLNSPHTIKIYTRLAKDLLNATPETPVLVKAGDQVSGQKVKGRWEIEESEVARLLATRCDQPVDRISSRGQAFGLARFFCPYRPL